MHGAELVDGAQLVLDRALQQLSLPPLKCW